MDKPLVSMIIPCFNGEKYLSNFLDSISNQTYKNIEIIFVDDGSTDNSKEIFFEWKNKNEMSFKSISYFYQKNAGQASAVNFALKKVNGDYLTWCDVDDILYPNNIECKVQEFINNQNIDIVFCSCCNVNPEGKQLNTYVRTRPINELFMDFILEKNVHFCPALYMIKIKTLFHYYQDKNIFVNRGGQNWQLLLPISFENKIKYIDQTLVDYLVREDSHSKKFSDINDIFKRLDEHKDIIINTLAKTNILNNKILDLINQKYVQLKFNYSLKNDYQQGVVTYYKKLPFCMKNFISYLLFQMHLFNYIYTKVKKL
ncbi:MAG: glycosyltransferase [Massilimicrobiota sp.]|nr:glycosyltransferase [Massilimicrobiota sp.]